MDSRYPRMEITKIIRKQEDGTYEATMSLTEEQTQFLINFAIGVLVQSGLANVIEVESDVSDEQPDAPTPEKFN